MLDFYLISENYQPYTSLSNLDYVGSINYNDFIHLQKLSIIEHWVDYSNNYRWTNEQVHTKYQVLRKLNKPSYRSWKRKVETPKTPEATFLYILREAIETDNELIAYSD
jgi:hypothetical protein